jgi:hypothetical protein
MSRELWLMIHPDQGSLARIRAVANWIVATVTGLR